MVISSKQKFKAVSAPIPHLGMALQQATGIEAPVSTTNFPAFNNPGTSYKILEEYF